MMPSDHRGDLHVLPSSTERPRLLELFQLQAGEGPGLDGFHAGEPVSIDDLAAQDRHWPAFTPEAVKPGFASVHAIPMRLRNETIGALNNRVIIEQAKGVLAQANTMAADDAFELLRSHARAHALRLSTIAATSLPTHSPQPTSSNTTRTTDTTAPRPVAPTACDSLRPRRATHSNEARVRLQRRCHVR